LQIKSPIYQEAARSFRIGMFKKNAQASCKKKPVDKGVKHCLTISINVCKDQAKTFFNPRRLLLTHHHHHDPEDTESELSFDEKILKLLDHWKKHNDEHAASYKKWAERVRADGKADIAALMESAAEKTILLNNEFQTAIDRLKK